MKWSWKIGKLAGIDIRVHATFFLLLVWAGWGSYTAEGGLLDALWGVLFIVLLFGIVVLHELGHALTARRYGVATRDITLLPIGGVARLERMPKNPRHELAVAVAGPAVNVALALVLLAVAVLGDVTIDPTAPTSSLLAQLLWLNVALAVFNLLPAFPLDGGRALRALLAMKMDDLRATEIAATLGQGLAVLLGLAGLFGNPLLILIAAFVWFGARAELSSAQLVDALGGIRVAVATIRDFEVVQSTDRISVAVAHSLHGFQRDYPVIDRGLLVGMLHDRALLQALADHGPDHPIAQAMDANPPTIRDDVDLGEALERLERAPCRCLLVLDASDRLTGMLTAESVAELVAVRRAAARRGRAGAPDREPLERLHPRASAGR